MRGCTGRTPGPSRWSSPWPLFVRTEDRKQNELTLGVGGAGGDTGRSSQSSPGVSHQTRLAPPKRDSAVRVWLWSPGAGRVPAPGSLQGRSRGPSARRGEGAGAQPEPRVCTDGPGTQAPWQRGWPEPAVQSRRRGGPASRTRLLRAMLSEPCHGEVRAHTRALPQGGLVSEGKPPSGQ